MELIKNKNGISYREKVYVDGRPVTKRFERKSDAKAWKAKMLSMREAQELGALHFEKVPFRDFAQKWLQEKILTYRSKSTYANYESDVRLHLNPYFGEMALNEIRVHHMDRFVAHLKQRGHNAQGVNLIVGCLKTLFNAAVEADYLRSSPLKNFKKLKIDLRDECYLSAMEIVQLLQANVNDPIYPTLVLALNTGMRKGELCGLVWNRVNFQASQIEIGAIRDKWGQRATTKTGKRRVVPMNVQVRALLLEMFKRKVGEHVLEERDGTPIDSHHLYRDFGKALKKAQIERHYRFHDLRHTFASHFMMNGGNIYDLQKILGHSQMEMTMRYAHLSPDHLGQAIHIVGFAAGETVQEESSEEVVRKSFRKDVLNP